MTDFNFENIFNKYSGMLLGIAWQIYPSQIDAEHIVITTFKKVHKLNISHKNGEIFSITLIRLLFKTAKELYPTKFEGMITLNRFEDMPLINQLIIDKIKFKDDCEKKMIEPQKVLKNLYLEFATIRNIFNERVNT